MFFIFFLLNEYLIVFIIISLRGIFRIRDGSDEYLNEEYCNRDLVVSIFGIKNEFGKVFFFGIIIF